ncbi:MAG: DUF6404 family protein [Planctomycetota bacterium]
MREFESKREAALLLLKATGIRESDYCPPLLRLLWRLRVQAPPPHFASFSAITIFAGALFAFTWGVLMWLLVWRNAGLSATAVVCASLLAGVLFGAFLAAYYAYGRRKHGLPDWNSLSTSSGAQSFARADKIMPTVFESGNEELAQLAANRSLSRLLGYFNARIREWPHPLKYMELFTVGVFFDLGSRFKSGDAFDLLTIAADMPLAELPDKHFLLAVDLIAELATSSDTTECPSALHKKLPSIKARVEALDPSYTAWDVLARQYSRDT